MPTILEKLSAPSSREVLTAKLKWKSGGWIIALAVLAVMFWHSHHATKPLPIGPPYHDAAWLQEHGYDQTYPR